MIMKILISIFSDLVGVSSILEMINDYTTDVKIIKK